MSGNFLLVVLVFFPFAAGLIAYLIGKKSESKRDCLAIAFAVIEFLVMAYLAISVNPTEMQPFVESYIPEFCGFGLYFSLDGFRVIYGTIAAFMWMMVTILSKEYFIHHENTNRFYLFLLWTLGATMGVFLSADLFTTFIFFEIMSFTSYVWVVQEENAPSIRAAETYLAVAVIGGLVLLMGLFLAYRELGTLNMSELFTTSQNSKNIGILYAAGVCMLVGFGAKAGAFPLHIWLPKAHPVAPAPASALLSGILTKAGVFGILVISANLFLHDKKWGMLLLILGTLTMFGGAVLAVFSIDLKRTLACSSMSQIGFILIGIGMQGLLGEENILAVHGTLLHMINHSMIKLVLFMAAGVIYMNTHKLDLNAIRGYGKKKPLLKAIFLAGALAIAGVPMFSGYISKTLLHESIVEYGGGILFTAIEWIFLFSGGLTAAYMTKLYVAIFVEKNKDDKIQKQFDTNKKYMSAGSTFALTGSAVVLFIWGLFPHQIMDKIAMLGETFMRMEEEGHEVAYFCFENLKGGLISLTIGMLVYIFFIRKVLITKNGVYVNAWPQWWDMENVIYRPIILRFLPFVFGVLSRIPDSLVDMLVVLLRKTIYKDSPLPHERPEGTLLTECLGHIMNFFQKFNNYLFRRKNPQNKDYVHLAAIKREEMKENNMVIQRSLSFGLLLFCIGFTLTLIYLIWW